MKPRPSATLGITDGLAVSSGARPARSSGGRQRHRVQGGSSVATSPRYVWDNGRSVIRARWYLRHADEVGTRVRLDGRPAVTNLGRMVIGERVQLFSTIATLELVAAEDGLLEIGPRTLVNFGCSLV